MSCPLPFVNFPDCTIPYNETNWWFDVFVGILQVWTLWNCRYSWRSLLEFSRNGLPQTVDGAQMLGAALTYTLLSLYLLNPYSLRHGVWLDVISTCARCLAFSGCTICGMILPLAAVRSAARMQNGYQGLPKWEVCAYGASCVVACAFSLPTMMVTVLAHMKEVPENVLKHCELIRCGGNCAVAVTCTILTLLLLHSARKDPRSKALLNMVKAHVYICIIAEFCVVYIIYKNQSREWKGIVGHMNWSVEEMDIMIAALLFVSAMVNATGSICLPRFRSLCGLQWGRPEGDKGWWVNAEEAAMVGALILFLGFGLYAPAVMQVQSFTVFLTLLIFVLCFAATIWIGKSGHAARNYLHDMCVATYLRKRDTSIVDAIKFRALSVNETAFDFLLFSTMPFSTSTPWPPGFESINWMDRLEEFSLSDERRSSVLTTLIVVYYAWLVVSFGVRLFPVPRPVGNAHIALSAFLYLPCALTATRLFLRGTQCHDDKTLKWGGMPCDESSLHRTVLIFGISGTIWCVCLPSLYFAGIGKHKQRRLIVQNPTVSVRTAFLRFSAVFSSVYLPGTSRIVAELAITALVTAQQLYDPLIIGRSRLNAFRASMLLAALTLHVLSPLNFLFPDSPVTILLCLVFVPTVGIIGFRETYKLYAATASEIKMQVTIAKNADFAKHDLPPRVLGACIHAPPLTRFLRTHLGIPAEKAKSRIAVTPENEPEQDDALTSLALAHLAGAISVRCGKRVLLEFSGYFTIMPRWLRSPHQSAAIKCVHAMADIEELRPVLRTCVMQALLAVWRLVGDEDHARCSQTLMKIRGLDKIIVTFGPIAQVRGLTIPRRTVWLVPHTPMITNEDPIDALLSFPHKWKLPPDNAMPLNIPHLTVVVSDVAASNSAVDSVISSCQVASFLGSKQSVIRSTEAFLIPRRSSARTGAPDPRIVTSSGDPPGCAEGAEGELVVVEESGEQPPSLADDEGTSIDEEGGSVVLPVAQQSAALKSVMARGIGAETSLVTRASWAPRQGEAKADAMEQESKPLASGLRDIARKASLLARRFSGVSQRRARREYVLFHLHEDCDMGTEDEDSVIVQRLRKVLTVFYAFNALPDNNCDQQTDAVHIDNGDRMKDVLKDHPESASEGGTIRRSQSIPSETVGVNGQRQQEILVPKETVPHNTHKSVASWLEYGKTKVRRFSV